MTKPLDNYEPRSWSVYPVPLDEGYSLPTAKAEGFIETNAEADMTKAYAETEDYNPSRMFFFDYEQMMMGHTTHGTGPLLVLTGEYRGHPEGKLLFVSYEGMEEDPPTFLIYVED